jgi:hypothetical protein
MATTDLNAMCDYDSVMEMGDRHGEWINRS